MIIGVIGLGTVGFGTVDILTKEKERLEKTIEVLRGGSLGSKLTLAIRN